MADKNYSVGLDVSVGTTLDEASARETERKIQERFAKKLTYSVEVQEGKTRPAKMARPSDLDVGEIFRKNLFRALDLGGLFKNFQVALPKFDTQSPFSGLGQTLDLVTGQFSDLKQQIKEAQAELTGEASDMGRIDFGGSVTSEVEMLKDAARDANLWMAEIAKATGMPLLNLDYLKEIDTQTAEVSDLLSGFAGVLQGDDNAGAIEAVRKQIFAQLKAEVEGLNAIDFAVLFEDGSEAFAQDEEIPAEVRERVTRLLSQLTDLEFGTDSEAKLREMQSKFSIIGDRVIPSVQLILDVWEETMREAQLLDVPVAAYEDKFAIKPRMGRGIPVGTDRSSLGDSKQAQRVTAGWQSQLKSLIADPSNADALRTWVDSLITEIAESVWQQAVESMQDSADFYANREFKGSEFDTSYITRSESADVSSGSNEMGYWLEDFVRKFREFTLKRGLEPGSEGELVDALRASIEAQGRTPTYQEATVFEALQNGFTVIESGFQNFTTNLDTQARSIASQIYDNPAIVTQKPLGGGAQKEIKELTFSLPKQLEDIKSLAQAAGLAAESVKELGSSAKDSAKTEAAIGIAEAQLESVQGWSDVWQKRADDEESDAEARAHAAEQVSRLALEQAEIEKQLIELRAKNAQTQIAAEEQAATPIEKHPLLEALDTFEKDFREKLVKLGKVDAVAFDTEFNNNLDQLITEAAITVKDSLGNIVDIFEFVQAPAFQSWAKTPGLKFQPRDRPGVERIASQAMIPGGIGSDEPTQNLIDFYEKISKTMFVLKTLADQNLGIIGNAAGSTDLNALGKAIEYINKKVAELGLNLPPIVDATPGMRTLEPLDMARGGAKDLAVGGKSLSNMMQNVLQNFSEYLDEEQKSMFRQGEKGLEVKVRDLQTGAETWLPAHFAKVDNRIALALKSVLDQLAPIESSIPKETADYAARRRAAEAKRQEKEARDAARAGGPSGPVEPPSGGGGGSDDSISGGGAAENARQYFLAVTQIEARQREMTQTEQEFALAALEKLKKTAGYLKLIEEEKSLRQEITDLQNSGGDAGAIQNLQKELRQVIVAGRNLEIQQFEGIKTELRAKDVRKQFQQTTASSVDTFIELEKAAKKTFSSEIRAQMQEQVQAAKAVEAQSKNLINSWVTGRYALYDVGNAYAAVSRQLWMASRQIFNITQAYRSYETAFTSVERAIEPLAATLAGAREESASLKQAFIELSEQIPVSFEEISRIATLGAQMGVSASGIVGFTEVVAQFASVTGVAADTVAQKFGRIAELANVDYSQFSNLGSAVLFAGMNAVATEPEILTLSESIAAVSTQAGLLPGEIVGMATALASTGIQAEQARGVFTRVFADIDRVVSRGGAGLDNFAKLAGMSSEDFAAAWGTEGASYDVFRAILGGLGATKDLTAAFDSLNIVETREINTLTRLAENLNVVDQAISDANGSFETGAFLGDTFGKTVDNLDAQIQIFNNNVKALTEELSKGLAAGIGFVIEPMNGLLQIMKEMAKNPLFSVLAASSLGVTALGAAATLGVSAFAKLIAQIYAFRVAAINTTNSSTSITGMGNMLKQLTGWGGGLIEMRDQLKAASSDVRGVITPVTSKLSDSLSDSVGRLSNKFNFLGKEIKDVNAVKSRLLEVDNIYLANSRSEADAVTKMVNQRKLLLEQIDSETAGNAEMRNELLARIGGSKMLITTVRGEVVAYSELQLAKDRATFASKTATEQEKAEAAERIKNRAAIDAETKAASRASKMSLGPAAMFMSAATWATGALAAVSLISTAIAAVSAAIEKTKINILESGGGVASLRDAIKQDTVEFNKLTAAQQANSESFTTVSVKTKTYSTEANNTALAIQKITGVSNDFVDANKGVVEGVEDSTLALGNNTRAWFANAIMQDENFKKTIEKYPDLLQQLESQGFNVSQVLNDIFSAAENGGDPLKEINRRYNELYDQILILNNEDAVGNAQKVKALQEQIGVIELIKDALTSVSEALGVAINENEIYNAIKTALGVTDEFDDSLGNAEDSANNLAEALRTVVDYAGDLSGILSRVIELEFGKQMTRDDITTGWRDLAESVNDAKDAITEANNEIKGLTADRSILEYQLSVAERYGDEARAAKIRAELAKVNKQIVDSEEQLAEAQSNSSTELEGNSDAAIRNRASLIDMLGLYQARIEMLAKLGMNESQLAKSSKDLRDQFLAEAKALGFSEAQLTEYADVFDNFASVASDAPRDVDIEIIPGLTAAEQAIQEFLAKDRSTTVTVDADIDDAEDDLDKFVNKKRVLTPAELREVNTLAANGKLSNWLYLEREFGAPKVTGITADAADTKIRNWLAQSRSLGVIDVHKLAFKDAEAQLELWLKQGRKLSVEVVTTAKSSSLAQTQATAALNLARRFPTDSTYYTSYMEMYRYLNKIANDLRGQGMATGGLVAGPGSGTSDSIPAMLSNGEYVMRASSVSAYGVDFFNALNQQRVGFAPTSNMGGAMSQQGPSMVFLSPEDRQLLRQFGDRPVNLYADSTKIAEVANSGNTKMSRRGSR